VARSHSFPMFGLVYRSSRFSCMSTVKHVSFSNSPSQGPILFHRFTRSFLNFHKTQLFKSCGVFDAPVRNLCLRCKIMKISPIARFSKNPVRLNFCLVFSRALSSFTKSLPVTNEENVITWYYLVVQHSI
jgi:hypothetical protein